MKNIKKIPALLLLVSMIVLGSTYAASQQTDLVVFSFNRPLQLYSFLESFDYFVRGVGEITVIYRSDDEFAAGYEEVHKTFSSVNFVRQGKNPKADFKPLVVRHSFQSPNPYIIYAVDDIIVKDHIDLSTCIEKMSQYNAYGFYLRLGTGVTYSYMRKMKAPLPPCQEIEDGLYKWRFSGVSHWNYPHTVDMTLYKKSDIKKTVQSVIFFCSE